MAIDCIDTDQFLASIEKGLNQFGHIPLVSTISAAFRGAIFTLVSKVAILATIFFAAATLFTLICGGNYKNYWHATLHSVLIFGHTIVNALRVFVEAIPIINLVTIFYDRRHRLCYPGEITVIRPEIYSNESTQA